MGDALLLYRKNKRIYDSLPEEYSSAIFNSIIARSIQRGDLEEELKLYLSNDELEEILRENEIDNIQKQKRRVKKQVQKKEATKTLFDDSKQENTSDKSSSIFTLN